VQHIVIAARGAINTLVAEIIEDHIRMHVIDPAVERSPSQLKSAAELVDVVQAYLK
jgi:DNA-binding FrmR family transcriptional regulator